MNTGLNSRRAVLEMFGGPTDAGISRSSPAASRNQHPAADDRQCPEDDQEPQGSKRTQTILVVEDDEDVRAIVEELLSDNGYAVLSASNGQEAVKHLQSSEPIDLLFTDVVMPGGMNGPDVAAAAGRIRPGLQVLFTSGYLGHALAGGGRSALGPSPFLAKPYRPAKLVDVIKGLLGT